MPDWIVTLSHPDFNRRPRNYTGSADLFAMAKSARGLSTCSPRSVTA
ncbi:putative cytoplasmic protein, partial [Salmonella enterica subsp. enterica serovar Baildon str. R6-199]